MSLSKRTIAISAAAVLGVAAVGTYGLVSSAGASQQPAAPAATPVDVAPVVARNVAEWDEFSGRIEAVERVEIRPLVGGTVTGSVAIGIVTGGTLVGIALLALLIWLPSAWRSALAVACLSIGIVLVNITPENPYQNTPAFLFASQQTHLSSFSNIVRVLSQLWPFATIALLCVLGRHAGPPLQTENAA